MRPAPVIAALMSVGAVAFAAGLDESRRPAGLPTPNLAPADCVCSAGINLAAPGEPPSVIRNCQCGAMQCVVHVGSGQLQCR